MHKTKILLVDDKPVNIVALRNLIEARDVEILSAGSGDEALALLLAHDVGLAIVDVQMPEMGGFELARLMRGVERTRRIPIIFVTASQRTKAEVFEGYEQGAVDFLFKPLDPHVVRSKVRVFVDLDQKSAALREQVKELARLKSEAEKASLAKTRFLANMSHEIRTPLGAVLGFADLLNEPSQTDSDRQSCIQAITRNGRLLLTLIDDVLDLSKIEAGKLDLERVPMSLRELLLDLKAVHSHRATEKSIGFEIDVETPLPMQVLSDPLRVRQVLNNVIGNAVKFTERGAVTLRIGLEGVGSGRRLRFAVSDTGIGLSDEERLRLFQPFVQADSSTSRKFGGTGLGLVISRRLALLLGGELTLHHSVPGQGSMFVVTIDPGPVDQGQLVSPVTILSDERDDAATAWRPPNLAGMRVLVVDDAKDNRLLLSRLLSLAGAEVELAVNGEDAVRKAKSGTHDVVLMDLQMPDLDGYEATARLRKGGYKAPIVALTAHAMREELLRALEAGCNDHLTKPVGKRELMETVLRFGKGSAPLLESPEIAADR